MTYKFLFKTHFDVCGEHFLVSQIHASYCQQQSPPTSICVHFFWNVSVVLRLQLF